MCSNMSDEEVESIVKSKLKITYIGHSLGGMLLPMYVIYSKLLKRDHHLSKAILMAPAGTHFHSNWIINLFGKTCNYVIPCFTDKVYIPEILMTSTDKILNEVKQLPAVNDLFSLVASQMVGGSSHGKMAIISRSAKAMTGMVHFGFSAKFGIQMYNMYQK